MWHKNFSDRLVAWNQLRTFNAHNPVEQALLNINSWWFETPWMPYHLHWDDQHTWPTPWQLLDDNLFCPVARGLGILYTVSMLERPDMADAELIESGGDYLVLVCQKKYILNWDQVEIANVMLTQTSGLRSINLDQIKNLIK